MRLRQVLPPRCLRGELDRTFNLVPRNLRLPTDTTSRVFGSIAYPQLFNLLQECFTTAVNRKYFTVYCLLRIVWSLACRASASPGLTMLRSG